jgi:hypothetical protein
MERDYPKGVLQQLHKSVGLGQHNKVQIEDIADALIAEGYTSLDEQAKALGLHRATAWTIIKTKHKVGRLNAPTTERMLANPRLPPSVRLVLLRYVAERSGGGRPLQENKSSRAKIHKIRQGWHDVPL